MKPSEKISKFIDEHELNTLHENKDVVEVSDLEALAAELDAQHDALKADIKQNLLVMVMMTKDKEGNYNFIHNTQNEIIEDHNRQVILDAAKYLEEEWACGDEDFWQTLNALIKYAESKGYDTK